MLVANLLLDVTAGLEIKITQHVVQLTQGEGMINKILLRTTVALILLLALGACGGSGGGGSRAGEFTCTWDNSKWDNGCLWGS